MKKIESLTDKNLPRLAVAKPGWPVFEVLPSDDRTKKPPPKAGTCGRCVSFKDGCCTNRIATLGAVIQTGRDSTCNWFCDAGAIDQTGLSEK